MDSSNRMPHRRIKKHQDAAQHLARDIEGLYRDQYRFALLVVGNALSEIPGNAQCTREMLSEILPPPRDRSFLQFLPDGRLPRPEYRARAQRRDDMEVAQDQRALQGAGCKKCFAEFAGRD